MSDAQPDSPPAPAHSPLKRGALREAELQSSPRQVSQPEGRAGGQYSQVSRQRGQVPRHGREPELRAVGRQRDAALLAVAGDRAGGGRRARLGGARGGAERGAQPQRAQRGRAGHRGGQPGTWRRAAGARVDGRRAPRCGDGGRSQSAGTLQPERRAHCRVRVPPFHGLGLAREGDPGGGGVTGTFRAAVAPFPPSSLLAGVPSGKGKAARNPKTASRARGAGACTSLGPGPRSPCRDGHGSRDPLEDPQE